MELKLNALTVKLALCAKQVKVCSGKEREQGTVRAACPTGLEVIDLGRWVDGLPSTQKPC
jgi:endogenous inhibitor of DNA gyrase (YacG/DUF329 family)